MKSKEEFIAGIYEKAAAYTEEKQHKVITLNVAGKVSGIAAAFAVCLCLAGAGSSMLHSNHPAEQGNIGMSRMAGEENNGIAIHSGDMEFPADVSPVTREVCLKGTVKEFVEEEQTVLLLLETLSETEYSSTESPLVAVRLATEERMEAGNLLPGMQMEVCAKMAEDFYEAAEGNSLLLFEATEKAIIRMEEGTSGE